MAVSNRRRAVRGGKEGQRVIGGGKVGRNTVRGVCGKAGKKEGRQMGEREGGMEERRKIGWRGDRRIFKVI